MQLKNIFGKKFNFITAIIIIYFSLVHFLNIKHNIFISLS